MASDFRRYAVSRSDSISRHKEIGTITAVGSPPSFETYWISAPAINYSVLLNWSRMFCHTGQVVQKIAVTLDQRTVADLDRWVKEGKYPNRSRALQSAVNILTEREERTRLVRELAKIDPKEEKQLAEQGLGDRAWPAY